MTTALSLVAQNTGASESEIKEVLSGMIISAKNQHGSVATGAELAVVTGVASKYGLNPLVREMAAFISGGKLQVTVMIDGWYKLVNRQETFDGVEFEDKFDDNGKIVSITCKMYLTNRSRPVTVTEYLAECRKTGNGADVWNKWPSRMLRHKSYIQAARMAFGISEIVDPDEADRIKSSADHEVQDVTPVNEPCSHIDYDSEMAECGDLETLKQVCHDIRKSLEASGKWAAHKSEIVALNTKHKERINSYVVEDGDFEEVVENSEGIERTVITKQSPTEEPDIAFEDDDEEF